MKRSGNLWLRVVDFENLWEAVRRARKGKRFSTETLRFDHDLEFNLLGLREELRSKRYRPGQYRTFEIFEPKRRLISAAPYRDRVVHHALCRVVEPLFDRGFIDESFANRRGYGTHRALKLFTSFLRSSDYVLQCDVRKFFPSIDHELLKGLLRRRVKCADTLWLLDTIVDGSNDQEPVIEWFPGDGLFEPVGRRRGLPIGNLTSQFFGNVYLDALDHFVKETLRWRKYLRFVDDFALFGDDADGLTEARRYVEDFLVGLRLKIHPVKSQLRCCCHGASFLGFVIGPTKIRVRGENLRRARRRVRRLRGEYADGRIGVVDVAASVGSWFAHLAHGDTAGLRRRIAEGLVFVRSTTASRGDGVGNFVCCGAVPGTTTPRTAAPPIATGTNPTTATTTTACG